MFDVNFNLSGVALLTEWVLMRPSGNPSDLILRRPAFMIAAILFLNRIHISREVITIESHDPQEGSAGFRASPGHGGDART